MEKPGTTIRMFVRATMSPFFPMVIFLVFLALALLLRSGLVQQNTGHIEQSLSNEARALADNLERELTIHAAAIGRMADRLALDGNFSQALWRADAQNYLDDFNVYQAIEWIDRDFVIRWLEPLTGNIDVIGYHVAFNEQRRQALEQAAATGNFDLSDIIDLRQGGKGMAIYSPIGEGEDNNGFIAGVFRMEVLAEQLLTSRMLEQFQVLIHHGENLVYQLNASANVAPPVSHSAKVNLPNLDWRLTLRPNRSWMASHRSGWPDATLLSLILMGALTSLTTLLVQLILRRNQALLKTRRDLEQEIDQRKTIQVDLERLESTDTLTGLANRRFFMEDLAHTLNIADRQMRQVALVMMDLDRFQMLNDSLGHQFGDELLIEVSERLNELSNERILVAYSGGDEFMVCQQHVDDIDDVIHLLGQLKHCFHKPFEVQGEEHSITATMGVAVYPQSGLDAHTLLRNSDIALYRAKDQGRNTYQFYTEGMQDQEVKRLELEKDLSQALANDEFVLYYQPQLDLSNNQIHNVEALIRWQHPRRGLLAPGEFIPLAEENGRINDIGRWVIRAACRQLARWKGTPYRNLRIAVNLSGLELDEDDLVDYIHNALLTEGVSPSSLEVELTEEIFIQNIEHNLDQLSRLRELGVRLAIDDFGVGYSSLAYLRDFPVDLLKIDRSFITHVTRRHDDAVITRAVINLAHNLGIRVVAEGVETEDQLNFLRHHSCNLAQGFLISRPVPTADLENALIEGLPFTSVPASP